MKDYLTLTFRYIIAISQDIIKNKVDRHAWIQLSEGKSVGAGFKPAPTIVRWTFQSAWSQAGIPRGAGLRHVSVFPEAKGVLS